jgi:hypothetical protein
MYLAAVANLYRGQLRLDFVDGHFVALLFVVPLCSHDLA